MRTRGLVLLVAGGLTAWAGIARGQDDATIRDIMEPPVQTPTPAPEPWTPPVFSDPDLAQIAQLLTGTWKTTAPVAEAGNAEARTDIVMNIVPVRLDEDVPDALYVELARADALHAPYRQAIFQLYKFKGKPRLRTYEFFRKPYQPAVVGLWAAPEFFPRVARADLIATLDVELSGSGSNWSGRTPYPYPTGVGGAVEMTSELTIGPDAIVSIDRGYNAEGRVVWGSAPGERYSFTRVEPQVKVWRTPTDVLIMEYKRPETDQQIAPGDRAFMHYSGWLTDGTKFDSSRDRGQPVPFDITEGRLIPGFIAGTVGATTGTIRRLIIPPAQGYGDVGAGRMIPPNATLIFEVEVMAIQKPTPMEPVKDPSGEEGGKPGTPGDNPDKDGGEDLTG